jgi:capsular polysaccharide biosynthesis protein
LEAIAVAHGFQRFEPPADKHEEQVRQFRAAEVVVAAPGAAQTHLLYSRPGTTVMEMFPQDFVKSTYLWLALRLNMNYRAILGDVGDYRQAFRVPAEAFTSALQDALEAREIAAAPWTAVDQRQTASGSRLAS